MAPYGDRRTLVDVDLTLDAATFKVCDQGPGFDTSRIPQKSDPSTLHNDQSRGMVLVQNFMDEVQYNEKGNEVTMVMRAIRAPA